MEEDDDCRPNTVEVCVNSTGQIEKPITFYVIFYSGSAKGLFLNINLKYCFYRDANHSLTHSLRYSVTHLLSYCLTYSKFNHLIKRVYSTQAKRMVW